MRDLTIDRPRTEPEPVMPAEAQEAAREAAIIGAILDLLDEEGFAGTSASWSANDVYRVVAREYKALKAECDEYGVEIPKVSLELRR